MNAIAKSLSKALGEAFEQEDGEKRGKYLLRVTKAAAKLPDDEFATLSEDAQEWVNTNVRLAKKQEALTDFERDADGDEKPAKKASKADDDADEKPAKKKAAAADDDDDKPAKKPAKKAAAEDDDEKPAKKKKPAAERAPRKRDPNGHVLRLVKMIIKNPDLTKSQLAEKAKTAEMEVGAGTLNTVHYHARNVIHVLKEMGRWES